MTGTLFGYELAGDVRLHRARAGRGPRGLLRLCASDRLSSLQPAAEPVFAVESPEAQVQLSRAEGGLLVSCSRTGNYLLEPSDLRVTFDGSPGDPAWEHRLVSTILPLLLSEHGELVIHASAVLGPSGAIIFCGPSGRGKSTTAAALASRGYSLLTDDGCVITDLALAPRLWPGPAGVVVDESAMVAVGAPAWEPGSRPSETWRRRLVHMPPEPDGVEVEGAADICAVVLLAAPGNGNGDGERAEPELIDPVDAVPALMSSALLLETSRTREVMTSLARLAERVPVYHVRLADELPVAVEQAGAVAARISGER